MYHADYCVRFIPPRGEILDIGAGRGVFAYEMARRGYRVSAAEINPTYIREAGERIRSLGVPVSIVQAPAERLPFEDGRFDFINCSEVSEHAEDPVAMCREIHRLLKAGGKCYISFQSRYCFYDYHYGMYLINWFPRRWAEVILWALGRDKQDSAYIGRQRLESMHAYTFDALIPMLTSLGFLMEDIRVEKIKSKFGRSAPVILFGYEHILRPFYFNTFHLLLAKLH